MTILIYILIFIANIIYFFIKLFPVNNKKITFISRQSNNITIDFKLLKNELLSEDENLKIIELYKTIDSVSIF